MRKTFVLLATLLVATSLPWRADASTFDFSFAGPGVSGTITLTYGTAADAKYPQALEVTGISGVFSDSNNGLNIVNAPIGSLLALTHSAPETTNLLAPNDFSKFAVGAGLPPQNGGFLSYDNLFWPGGSPQTASDYPLYGGFLDIYGLMFRIGGGRVVDFWSNGGEPYTGHIDYGVAVATTDVSLDYVSGGVSVAPEPGTLVLFGSGIIGLGNLIIRRKINL